MERPQGTVTFLFTDIEGSTRLWEQYPEAMRSVLARHDMLLRRAIEQANGYVFKTIGDAFCAAFFTATDAFTAALTAQRGLPSPHDLLATDVGVRVRMALHTGVPEFRDNDYFGPPLNRVARLLAVGHGGQILLSRVTKELLSGTLPADVRLHDMGLHRLRDLQRPEQVFLALHPELGSEFPPLKSLDYVPTNLPQPLTSFIGRETEIVEVRRMLTGARLLTLTGPGGSGKTRLALQVGADSMDDYKDGVWQVEMASTSDPEFVPQAITAALGVREQAGRSIVEALTDYLAERNLLLILDNCEHLLTACGTLADRLLRRCAGLTILATSTESLHIQGERIYVVPTLSLPALPSGRAGEPLSELAALHGSEAVRLFTERASFVLSTFTLTARNGPAVARICHRLDGIPLAIELAAARIKALSVEQIAQRLDDRFRLLIGGNRAAMPRQQTLRALVDWSYELLTPSERTLLCRLAVFSGGWTLEAAEQVCSENGEVLDLLTSLVEKSLVVYEEGRDEPRYRLLETIRQYGLERLDRDEPGSPVWRAHLDYFAATTKEAITHLTDAEQGVWLRRLDTEHDNLRGAMGCALGAGENEATHDAQDEASYTPQRIGLRMAGLLSRYWLIRGYWTEGRQLLAAFLAFFQDRMEVHGSTDWANALNGAGALAWAQGDLDVAHTHFEACLTAWQQRGHVRGEAKTLGNLGVIALHQKDYASAQQLQIRCLEILNSLQDQDGMAASLVNLGLGAYEQGAYKASQAYYREAIDLYRALGNRGNMAGCLDTLGLIDGKSGDYSAARQAFAVAEATFRELGLRSGLADVLHSRAEVAYLHGEDAEALSALEESLDLYRELGEGRSLAAALTLQGKVALRMGNHSLATQSYRECMAFCLEKKAPQEMVARTEELADAAFTLEQRETFLHLYTIATRLRERYQIPRDASEEEVIEPRRRDALGRMSGATAVPILQAGSALPLEQLPTVLLETARTDDR